MIDFLKYLLQRPAKFETQNFSKLMEDPQNIYFYLPESPGLAHKIICNTINWQKIFQQVYYIVPNYYLSLFKKLDKDLNIFSTEHDLSIEVDSVVFNFNKQIKLRRILPKNVECIVIDIYDRSNIHFIPEPESPITYLQKFAEFFNLKLIYNDLSIENSKLELETIRRELIQNRFKNFLVMSTRKNANRRWSNFLHLIKREFAANIYLIRDKMIKDDFINLKHLDHDELLTVYKWAFITDLFIIDDHEIAELFIQFGIKALLINGTEDTAITKVDMQNEVDIKTKISNLLK